MKSIARPITNTIQAACFMLLIIAGMIFCTMHHAFATVTDFSGSQKQISGQIIYIPKLVAIIAYVIGTFFTASGLLKLKDWISEPAKNPLNAVIFRLVVASLLIALPKVLSLANSTMFGATATGSQSSNVNITMQKLNAF